MFQLCMKDYGIYKSEHKNEPLTMSTNCENW